MTSSLVGSEMCIRDSTDPAGAVKEQLLATHKAPKREVLPPLQNAEPQPCLLYTSDAADDM
eukprot:12651606-Prorocentrum_lima.AAC.1